ncbi:MAG: lysophospholipid acyltransferase family protein [Acetobacteraceae bacterium]
MILLRSALFNLYFFAVTALFSFASIGFRLFAPHRILIIPMLWARGVLAGLSAICAIRVEVLGAEHLPRQGAALIASRHQSAFDTVVWLTLLPRCCYVVKQELARIPLFGGMMRPAGMIVVDRAAGAGAMRHLMREAERAVREQRQIVIFPEGTRADTEAMGALQPGIAAMAARTGLPIIPVITNSGRHWGRRAFRKMPGTIRIALLAPIPPGLRREALMEALSTALAHDPAAREPVDKSGD